MKYCLGTVQFGLSYGIQGNGQPLKEKVFEMLNYAIDNEIEVLDTASVYGDAENILGAYLRENPERIGEVRVVSKLKPDAFLAHERSNWAGIAVEYAKESLAHLGIKRFTAYLFHNASYIFDENAVGALEAVRKQGLTERIGVSVYTPEEAMKALDYPSITVIQIPYNLFDQRLDACGFFEKAKDQDVLVFARSSLLQGLVMMDPENLPVRVSFAKNALKQFLEICNAYGIAPLEAAVGYVGCRQGIDYVVFGVDNFRQLDEYISIRNTILPESMVERIRNAFSNVDERLVNPTLWK